MTTHDFDAFVLPIRRFGPEAVCPERTFSILPETNQFVLVEARANQLRLRSFQKIRKSFTRQVLASERL